MPVVLPYRHMAVQFEEQQFNRPMPAAQKQGAVTNLIMKLGLAKNAQQANMVMVVIAVIAIGLTAFLMWPESSAPVADPALDPTLLP